jgi:8-oxo-dGTP pyrophosphatase MutT (NUDIX family)
VQLAFWCRGDACDFSRHRALGHFKGSIAGEAPHDSAAREALEEAGVVGEAGRDSIGTFTYEKRLSNGAIVICEVQVFPLEVKRQRTDWPEKEEREVRWFSLSEAAKAVQEAALSDIILGVVSRPQQC